MTTLLRKLNPFHRTHRVTSRRARRKSAGQSLVEIAIAFPFMLVLLSGVVEFGFLINFYLSILDATRYAARYASSSSPFNTDGTDNMNFYSTTASLVIRALNGSDPGSPLLTTDPTVDDIIVSVYSVSVDAGTGIPTVTRYPTAGVYRLYGNHNSAFDEASMVSQLEASGDPLVNTGVVLVEIYWGYHQVLKLPWTEAIMSDPTILHAYSMMPNSSAEPVVP